MAKLSKIKYQERAVENYKTRHNNRELYDRVKTRQNLMLNSREILSIILKCLQEACPVETGYGQKFGIRLKRVTTPRGKSSKLFYDIIIGSELPANAGQIHNAPYIAIQNIWEYNTDWIGKALYKARNIMVANSVLVQIYNPLIISKYNRKSAGPRDAGGVSGYKIRINMMYTQGVGI